MSEKYNGSQRKTKCGDFLYDSQLEAQWSVFWNDAAIVAVPQPATFKTGKFYLGEEICYTPDFYLPEYNVFCEVKPSDSLLDNCEIQRKISAAMDDHITPVGQGLLILGPMSNFGSSKSQKCLLGGKFYQWHHNAIWESYWYIGHFGNIENGIYFEEIGEWSSFANYPRFARSPSTTLFRDYDDIHASEIVYKAIFNAIYAKKNGLFTFEPDSSDFIQESNDFWIDIPKDSRENLPF